MMKPSTDDLRQLLDIPAQLLELDRTHNGLKSDKAKKGRELDSMKARHKIRISKEGGYSNADDRAAALVIACEDDPRYSATVERLEALDGMIRANRAQYDHLRRIREGLRVKCGTYIVDRLDDLVKDKDLATAISTGLLA